MANTKAAHTRAGHDPQALSILAAALAPHTTDTDKAWKVATKVFRTLHDCGLRITNAAGS